MYASQIITLTILILSEKIHGIPQRECKTDENGPQRKKSCQFPFIYQDRLRYFCITSPDKPRGPWCSTTAFYQSDKWGYCSEECFTGTYNIHIMFI